MKCARLLQMPCYLHFKGDILFNTVKVKFLKNFLVLFFEQNYEIKMLTHKVIEHDISFTF